MALLFTLLLSMGLLVLGYFVTYFAQANNGFMLKLSLLTMAFMVLVILTSFMISAFVVTRTSRIAEIAQEIIDTGDLSRRLVIDSKWDDLSYMAHILNNFLDRNEELVDGIKRVSDNIAHDLRTPLTRLRNRLEDLKKSSRDTQTAATAEELIGEADQLLGTFNALLRIARIEAAQQRHHFASLDLSVLLKDVADLYEPVANIVLHAGPVAPYEGDKDLLFQVFANLIDNAIKFTPAQGRIEIGLDKRESGYICTIRDEGPGIPSVEKEKVFTRFYRGEQSRHTAGNGLGLSLVAAVVALHHGKIELADAKPGLLVKITL